MTSALILTAAAALAAAAAAAGLHRSAEPRRAPVRKTHPKRR